MERPTFEKAMQDIINALPMDFYDDVEEIQSYIKMLEAENAALRDKNQKLRDWSEALENLIRAAKD